MESLDGILEMIMLVLIMSKLLQVVIVNDKDARINFFLLLVYISYLTYVIWSRNTSSFFLLLLILFCIALEVKSNQKRIFLYLNIGLLYISFALELIFVLN